MSDLTSSCLNAVSHFDQGPQIPIPYSTIHAAFEHIVDTDPDAIAAIHANHSLTYLQLDLAANRLAHYLIASGLRPRQRVGLVVQRSLEMLIGLLGILKAGCQYVPIDGGVVTDAALRHIVKDTEARFILCLPRYWDRVKRLSGACVVLEVGLETGLFYDKARPAVQVDGEDGVYAMYTSGEISTWFKTSVLIQAGSTGMPKGVDVRHGSMTNALLTEPGRLGMRVGSKVGQMLSISFGMGMSARRRSYLQIAYMGWYKRMGNAGGSGERRHAVSPWFGLGRDALKGSYSRSRHIKGLS
jgi:non-ribosomal peptide synthetase component F